MPYAARLARTRYLLAMGLLSACREPARPETSGSVADDARAPTVTATAVEDAAAPLATAPVIRQDAGSNTWTVTIPEKVTDGPAPYPRATCPSGQFCLTAAAAQTDAGTRRRPLTFAAAPFGTCPSEPPPQHHWNVSFNAELTKSERALEPDACCYSWYEPCPGGRPLRAGDTLLVAPARPSERWTLAPARAAVDAVTAARLARLWLAEAAVEHASVASFNRFALQLLALGAPPDLLAAAQHAALDEIRHAEACYALAARLTGERRGPGPLPLPPGELPTDPAVVTAETLRDGCFGESLAAMLAHEAAQLARDAHVARVLEGIAEDEEHHAELAWKTIAWLLRRHGEPVRHAIEAFRAHLSTLSLGGMAETATNDEAHGVLGAARRIAVHERVVRDVALPCLHALLEEPADTRGHEDASVTA